MDNYMIYSECIAISDFAVSFRVEVYTGDKQVAKANVIINRESWKSDTCWLTFPSNIPYEIIEKMRKKCAERAKTIWGI